VACEPAGDTNGEQRGSGNACDSRAGRRVDFWTEHERWNYQEREAGTHFKRRGRGEQVFHDFP